MNLFLIKFRNTKDDRNVYNELHKLSGGKTFLPIDSLTFILITEKDKNETLTSLNAKLGLNVFVLDISHNKIEDFLINDEFDQSHIENFISEFHTFSEDNCFENAKSEIDSILDMINEVGIENVSQERIKRLNELSNF